MGAMDIEQLRARVRGTIIQPGDAEYDSARKVYNAMIDKRPALIVRCVDTADVIAAVNYARANDTLTAIRGGGHNGAGLSTCDDGVVIDLSRMKGIRVDPAARTVRIEGGCTAGEMDHATHAFGLATPSGTVSTTGSSRFIARAIQSGQNIGTNPAKRSAVTSPPTSRYHREHGEKSYGSRW